MGQSIEEQLASAEMSIEFEDAREESLIREAVKGQEAREWLLSPVGRSVIEKAREDQEYLRAKIAQIRPNTPWRRRKIEELQQEYRSIQRAISWLADTVRIGVEAERELMEVDK